MSFTVLQKDILFIRLKSSEKRDSCSCFEFSWHNPKHEAQNEDPCDHAYKNSISTN